MANRGINKKRLMRVIVIILACVCVPYGIGRGVLAFDIMSKSMGLNPSEFWGCFLAGTSTLVALPVVVIIGVILYLIADGLFNYIYGEKES